MDTQQTTPIGLVLEGGGMRGMYTCGILDVLMQHDIWLDAMVGVSAGIAFGCNYKSRQPGRALRYNARFAHDKRYSGMRSLITTGNYYNADFAYHKVPRSYDIFDRDAFELSPMACWAVCTDVDTGEAVYQRLTRADDECLEWIRASSSMPVVAQPVELNGRRLLDGGLSDSIPIDFMLRQGYGHNIVVLTREQGYVKSAERWLWLMRPLLRRYPQVVKALERRPDLYNRQVQRVAELEREGSVLVFRPDGPLDISRTCHDPKQMARVYQLGRNQALARLAEVRAFIGQTSDK